MARTHLNRLAARAAVGIAAVGLALAGIPGPASATPATQASGSGSPFRIVASPSPGNPELQATAAISANDVWAVGYSLTNVALKPLAEHWNGSAWRVVSTPNPGGTSVARFTAVSAVASTDVWAIGVSGPRQAQVPFTEHWNGTTWSVIPIKDPTTTDNNVVFTGVKAISATNVYAIGAYQGLNDPIQFIEHWNGSFWKVVPNPFDAVIPSGINASSASDIWIVGAQRSGTFTEHFNGTAWSVVSTPAGQIINAVVDLSPTNAWAVGTDITLWNGSSWKVVPANVEGGLGAITSLSATDLWAVGSDNSGIGTIAEHFNGTSWSLVPTPSPSPTIDSALTGVSSAGGHVYAVGWTAPDNFTTKTLVLENDRG